MDLDEVQKHQSVAKSAFAGERDRGWGPKTAPGRRSAGKWWAGNLVTRTQQESIVALQKTIKKIKKRIRKRQSWLNHILKGRCPQSQTLNLVESHVPGSRNQFLNPFFRVAESTKPLAAWRSCVRPRLQPHLKGMWDSLELQHKIGSVETRRWKREASRCEFIDALCLLGGLCLLHSERADVAQAQAVAEMMMRAMLIEHSKFPITPFVVDLFSVCKSAFWNHFEEAYFEGYDFRIACASVPAIQALRKYRYDPGHDCDEMLLPGVRWRELNLCAGEIPLLLQVKHRRRPAKPLVIAPPSEAHKGTRRGSRQAQWASDFERINAVRSKMAAASQWTGWRILPREGSGRDPVMQVSVSLFEDGDSACVYFVVPAASETWVERPRHRWQWRYNPKPNYLDDMTEPSRQNDERMMFWPFPKKTRIFHLDKGFQPV